MMTDPDFPHISRRFAENACAMGVLARWTKPSHALNCSPDPSFPHISQEGEPRNDGGFRLFALFRAFPADGGLKMIARSRLPDHFAPSAPQLLA